MHLEAGLLTEDGILAQVEVSFTQHDFMATPRGARPRSVKKRAGTTTIRFRIVIVSQYRAGF